MFVLNIVWPNLWRHLLLCLQLRYG